MGRKAPCTVRLGDQVSQGKARLETDELIFRSESLRLNIPFRAMRSVEADNGDLRISYADETAVFELGALAEKWSQQILHPKSLLDKLGVKPEMKVSVLDVEDEGFLANLNERTGDVAVGDPRGDSDIIFVAVDGPGDLERLAGLKRLIAPNGAVWAVFRKGRRDFNENDVLRGGVGAGLVDVKVVRFSDTHTALKFVIRTNER